MRTLLEQRAKIADQAREILLKAEKESRALTSDEQVQYDKMRADIDALGETIKRSREMDALQTELRQGFGPVREIASAHAADKDSDKRHAALNAWLRGGNGALAQNEEFRGLLPRSPEGNDAIIFRAASPLAEGTGAAGGYTVPQDFYRVLTDAMKWYGGVRESGATIIRTAAGNPLPIPSANDTGNAGELLAENATASQASTEMSFGQVTLNGYKFSSKIVKVSIELLQDSAFDIGAFVAKKLGQRLGRVQNTYFTTGTGSSQPQGVLTGASAGITAAGATAITYNDLVGLTHSVDPAYRPDAKFMLHDNIASSLEKLADSAGRPLLNSTLNGISGVVRAGMATQPSTFTLLGYPVVINQDMTSTIATTNKTILFGDFSNYYIREVMDITLIRFAELYMTSGQVGFLAFMRADGAMVDPGTHPVVYLTQA